MKDLLIDETYRVDYKIGEGLGGRGLVYAGTNIRTKESVAIKLMRHEYVGQLEKEAEIYQALSSGVGFPQVSWHGQEGDYFALVMDLLGPSLEDLLNYCRRRLSLKTILLIADQAISQVEYIHSKGFLHGDIKPDNFVMGTGKHGNTLYTIDFGLAQKHSGTHKVRHVGINRIRGPGEGASLRSHYGHAKSWCDDLESLGYTFIYLSRGSLPWEAKSGVSWEENEKMVKEKKTNLPVKTVCEGLPEEFVTYINYTRSLQFGDKPDYAYLRQLFRNLFRHEGFKNDNIYDWTVRRFHELKSQASGP